MIIKIENKLLINCQKNIYCKSLKENLIKIYLLIPPIPELTLIFPVGISCARVAPRSREHGSGKINFFFGILEVELTGLKPTVRTVEVAFAKGAILADFVITFILNEKDVHLLVEHH